MAFSSIMVYTEIGLQLGAQKNDFGAVLQKDLARV